MKTDGPPVAFHIISDIDLPPPVELLRPGVPGACMGVDFCTDRQHHARTARATHA